jgi:acyl dehydratase
VSSVRNTLRITTEQVLRFAAASGDRNPLHVDARYARHTPYGRPIAQGALVAIGALAACDPERVRFARRIDLQFKQPVFPGEEYSASRLHGDAEPASRSPEAGPSRCP